MRLQQKTINGRWVQGTLQGKGSIVFADGTTEYVTWRDGIIVVQLEKVANEGRTWQCGILCNALLVGAGVGCLAGFYFVKDQATRRALLGSAAFLYLGQIVESFCSSQWRLLRN